MVWTNPRTWLVGEIVTAAYMNAHVRDNFKAIGDPWTAYTPTWSSSTPPTLGNGTLTGNYISVGKLTFFNVKVVVGSTTNVGAGNYTWTLPVSATYTSFQAIGQGNFYDASANAQFGKILVQYSATTVGLIEAGAVGGRVAALTPLTTATGDIITLSGCYEAA